MPNHYFFHLLNTNPLYANSMQKLSYLNTHYNPKAHAHGGSAIRRYEPPPVPHHILDARGISAVMHHTKRRPTPLKFRI